tara:strand:+ start:117 stop:440 length:324 start_codon:yes stop_codon:yes gene_type:complete
MKLTLHIDIVDTETFETKRQMKIKRNLPNKDGFHLFEAWLHLSMCEGKMPSVIVDGVMDMIYDIVQLEANSVLGFTEKDYRDGKFDIDDPIVEDEDNMSAIITMYAN